jgi:hypothetical protein
MGGDNENKTLAETGLPFPGRLPGTLISAYCKGGCGVGHGILRISRMLGEQAKKGCFIRAVTIHYVPSNSLVLRKAFDP